MSISAGIFKAYDIRGLADSELSPELAYKVGRSFAQWLSARGVDVSLSRLVAGRDMRSTSLQFQKEVMRGMTDAGASVVDIGLVSTPIFNFACAHYPEHAGGIMVTASHNPAQYNGFKLTLGNGEGVGRGSGMEEIRDMVCAMESGVPGSEFRVGEITHRDVVSDYIKKIFSLVPKEHIRPLKLAVDFGNGMGSVCTPAVLGALRVEALYLYDTPDGTFPNHEANPIKTETLRDLQKKVVATGADFGFAFDGDADRIGLVDETGAVVDASFVTAMVGLEVLRAHPGGNMLYDLRQSMIVPETWRAAGAGAVEKSRVGHAYIKKIMKEKNFVFAGELSLHLYFHDVYDLEASDLSLLYILQMLSREQKSLSALVAPLKKYVHSGEINFKVADTAAAMRAVESALAADALEISRLDGVWMSFPWGFVSVRISNTEPLLRLNLEANTKEIMEEKVAEMRKVIG